MINKSILVGHVGQDPTLNETEKGNRVATFSLATSERWTDKATGEKREKTEWHNIVVWGDALASKVVGAFVKKGSKLFIEGQSKTRKYTDKSGIDRYRTEVVVQGFSGTIQLLDKASGAYGGDAGMPEEPDQGQMPLQDDPSQGIAA